jgi:hypothetical protein
MRRSFAGLVTTACLAAGLLAASCPVSAASAPATPSFTPQQKAGLAALQKRIDATVAKTGGRQTGIDEISWDNGAVVMTFPMPAGVESLAARTMTAAATRYNYGCPYGGTDRWFCLYENRDFNGLRPSDTVAGNGRRLRFKDGGYQALHRYDFDNKTSSWLNNNTHRWEVYNWLRGDPNCSVNDVYSLVGSFEAPGARTGSEFTSSRFVGTADNDLADCVHRL